MRSSHSSVRETNVTFSLTPLYTIERTKKPRNERTLLTRGCALVRSEPFEGSSGEGANFYAIRELGAYLSRVSHLRFSISPPLPFRRIFVEKSSLSSLARVSSPEMPYNVQRYEETWIFEERYHA